MSIARSKIARVIGRVAAAKDASFAELILLAQLNPRSDFRGADLSGVDFGSMDISGFDFTRSNLAGCNFSRVSGYAGAVFNFAIVDDLLAPTFTKKYEAEAKPKRERDHQVFLALREGLELAAKHFADHSIFALEHAFRARWLRVVMAQIGDSYHRVLPTADGSLLKLARYQPMRPETLKVNIILPKRITVAELAAVQQQKTNGRWQRAMLVDYTNYRRSESIMLCEGYLHGRRPQVVREYDEDEDENEDWDLNVDRANIALSPLEGHWEGQKAFRRLLKRHNPDNAMGARLAKVAYKALNGSLLAPRSYDGLSIDVKFDSYRAPKK